jgi:hypothetical protein
MRIQGLEGMSASEIQLELQRGAKFVVYTYCVSLILVTIRRPSEIYFLRPGSSRVRQGLASSVVTLLLGWWGIPWGPIYSVKALVENFRGGKDVTADFLPRIQPASVKLAASAARIG